jgi:4-hydroxy-tetrahydrodipicolinate reductase
MGKRIIQRIQGTEGIQLSAALELPGHPGQGEDVGDLAGIGRLDIPLTTELASVLNACDVVIDFTSPEVSLKNIRAASEAGKSMVIGTTGFSDQDLGTIKDCSTNAPHLLAPNMSLGINLLLKILPGVAALLREDFDIEIVEAHHHFKKDAPSGTAVRLAEVIAEALNRDPAASLVHGRQGNVGARGPKEIGMHAVRGGDIVGEHTVMFCGTGERIEFVHKASSRDTFANGAVRAAQWIISQKPGLYSMNDMLEL